MKKILAINLIGLLALSGFVLWSHFTKKTAAVVYVDAIRLFNEYQFKKAMYQRIEQSFADPMARMDSLERYIASGPAGTEQYRLFEMEREELSYNITHSKNETDRVIWERLNQAVKRFGDNAQYEIIMGANGMGTVLYGQQQTDITDLVIKYVNQDYEGK